MTVDGSFPEFGKEPPAGLRITQPKNEQRKPLKNGWLEDDPFLLWETIFSGANCWFQREYIPASERHIWLDKKNSSQITRSEVKLEGYMWGVWAMVTLG